jgi:purine catabolism regulator
MAPSAAFTVEHLVRSPALQLRVLAGAAGLGRSVSWAHVSELSDPTPWLLGAEVIMSTGIAIPRTGAEQRAYLERLDDAGVSALALSEQLHVPPLRREFFAAADERGIPVLEVALPVPFIAIAQEVAAAVQADVRQRLGAQLQVFGALRWLTMENLDNADIFDRLEQLSGYDLYLCTSQRRPLLPGVRAPREDQLHLLPSSPSSPPTVPGGFVLPVQAPGGEAGFLLALAQHSAQPGGLAVVQHIATVASLQLTMLRHERETLRREGAETLAEMLARALDPETARRRLHRSGFAHVDKVILSVVRGRAGEPDESELLRGLEDADLPHLLLRQQDELVLLLPDGAPALTLLDAAAGNYAGSSSPFDPGDRLDVPHREARWAAARARGAGRAHLSYGEDDPAGRWLPEDVHALDALVTRVLGPAIDYDSAHQSQLVGTVRTWMERDRRTEEAARALQVHANTLTYRLRRFTQITGRDLAVTADLAEVWLALLAQRHLGEPARALATPGARAGAAAPAAPARRAH